MLIAVCGISQRRRVRTNAARGEEASRETTAGGQHRDTCKTAGVQSAAPREERDGHPLGFSPRTY